MTVWYFSKPFTNGLAKMTLYVFCSQLVHISQLISLFNSVMSAVYLRWVLWSVSLLPPAITVLPQSSVLGKSNWLDTENTLNEL